MKFQAVLIDRLQPKKHVLQTETAPVRENFFAAAEHVGASLEVVLFFDVTLFELAADREAMLGMNEGDVVDDKDVRLANRGHVLCDRLRRGFAVAASVKRPCAAERAVP